MESGIYRSVQAEIPSTRPRSSDKICPTTTDPPEACGSVLESWQARLSTRSAGFGSGDRVTPVTQYVRLEFPKFSFVTHQILEVNKIQNPTLVVDRRAYQPSESLLHDIRRSVVVGQISFEWLRFGTKTLPGTNSGFLYFFVQTTRKN